jgi:hypothetical protein
MVEAHTDATAFKHIEAGLWLIENGLDLTSHLWSEGTASARRYHSTLLKSSSDFSKKDATPTP